MSDPADDRLGLHRFLAAQEPVFDQVLEELRSGAKRTHWMWFVFPQVRGLGTSQTARFYAVADLEEARMYLTHEILGPRLLAALTALGPADGRSLTAVLGSPDDLKFRSCMTLFAVADPSGPYEGALRSWCDGEKDERTLAILEGISLDSQETGLRGRMRSLR